MSDSLITFDQLENDYDDADLARVAFENRTAWNATIGREMDPESGTEFYLFWNDPSGDTKKNRVFHLVATTEGVAVESKPKWGHMTRIAKREA